MASEVLTPVILCGGAGTRLWPVSREELPKQFVSLLGDRTSFQDTLLRVRDPSLFGPPIVITNERYAGVVEAQLREVGAEATIVIEPMRRDSGPAIAACAALAAERDPATTLIVLPSDHVVRDEDAFRTAARNALAGAARGFIVTFGIRPDHPATGYGYIRPDEHEVAAGLWKAARFVEKPNLPTAQGYLSEGYLWNAGNFVFRADVLLAEYEARDGGTVQAARDAVARAEARPNGVVLDRDAFERCRAQSIDYAVIEASSRVAVIPVSMGWSDVGSWHAVWELSDKDDAGNVAQGEAVFVEARDNMVRADGQLVCLVGVNGLGVIATRDAVLVFDRASDPPIKRAIEVLKERGHPSVQRHPSPVSDRDVSGASS